MPQRSSPLLFLALVAALGGCQDYNFSPVKYAVIQPGTERVTLSEISTADILFVVDDSGSMGLKQQKLAASFDAFVESLKTSNEARVAAELAPIDFHIAVTTTSVFLNAPTTSSCSAACGGAAGHQVCCDSVSSLPLKVVKGCATSAECGSGNTCRTDCLGRGGELTCCTGAGAQPERANQACPTLGEPCGLLQDRYVVPRSPRLCSGGLSCATGPAGGAGAAPAGYSCRSDCIGLGGTSACCSDTTRVAWRDETCALGVGSEGGLYPRGDFVRAGSNPRVLHFTKALFCPPPVAPATTGCGPRDDAAINALVQRFKDNVKVGTCGSGQEQGMEAAKRALQKSLRLDGMKQPDDVALAEWPQRDAADSTKIGKTKLVVVWVGDEDDCSGPEDPNKGVIFAVSGTDACVLDGLKDPAEQRLYTVQSYRDFLTSLGQPVAGAFIVSAVGSPCQTGAECRALCGRDSCPNNCVDGACRADLCASDTDVDPYCTTDPSGQLTCGGVAAGSRFLSLSTALGAKGSDTVAGSVCQAGEGALTSLPAKVSFPAAGAGFSSILKRVAEVVKQPAGLSLPTQPASAALTVLRIVGKDGKTKKTCYGPADVGTTQAAAQAAVPPWDWWFTGPDETVRTATGPSRFVYINRATGNCTADAGETYSADYLGLVPAGGCAGPADCQAALGATVDDWKCQVPAGSARGTCIYSSAH